MPCCAGNLLGLVVSPLLLAAVGWRSMFLLFGVLGVPLLLLWNRVVPSAAEAAAMTPSGPSPAGAYLPAPLYPCF